MSKSARRHHRVAKKEVEYCREKGIFIPERKAICILIGLVVMLFVVFFKGMIIANWFNKCE